MNSYLFAGGGTLEELTELIETTAPHCVICGQPASSVCLERGCNNQIYCHGCSKGHLVHRSHDIRALFLSHTFPEREKELLQEALLQKHQTKETRLQNFYQKLTSDLRRVISYREERLSNSWPHERLYKVVEGYFLGKATREKVVESLIEGLQNLEFDYPAWPFPTITVESLELEYVRASNVNACLRLINLIQRFTQLRHDNPGQEFVNMLRRTCYQSKHHQTQLFGNQSKSFIEMTITEAEDYITNQNRTTQQLPLRLHLKLFGTIEPGSIWDGFLQRFEGIREIYIDFQLAALPTRYPVGLQRLNLRVRDLRKVTVLNALPPSLTDLRITTSNSTVSYNHLIAALQSLPLLNSFVLNVKDISKLQQKWLLRFAIAQHLNRFQLSLKSQNQMFLSIRSLMLQRNCLMAQAVALARRKTISGMCWNQLVDLLQTVGWQVEDLD